MGSKFGQVMRESGCLADEGNADDGPTVRTLFAAMEALPSEIAGADAAACSICQEPMAETRVLKLATCRHTFHRSCLLTWVLRQNECPVCRERVLADWARHVMTATPPDRGEP